jgi:GNAT superfamily N-acetyltransferase
MPDIELFQPGHLPQVQTLVNAHMSALVPGWALPEAYIASRLERNPGEYVVDPWVVARATLCAIERQRVVAVAHLLRYGGGAEVDPHLRDTSEIDWFLAWPDAAPGAAAVLAAAREQFTRWAVRAVWVAGVGPAVGPTAGLPDAWPHIVAALVAAGYGPDPETAREEAVYAGYLDQIPPPEAPPREGMTIQRRVGLFGTRFTALVQGEAVGYCECVSHLTEGGSLPALAGWGELAELEVRQAWRDRGVGAWLVRHAAAWLRMGGCNRIVLAVAAQDEAAGAGRFYERQGWRSLARLQRGWKLRDTHFNEQEGTSHAYS